MGEECEIPLEIVLKAGKMIKMGKLEVQVFFSLKSLKPKLPRIATVVEDVPSVDKKTFFSHSL